MNVLHISPCQGSFGGIEAFVLALADELSNKGNTTRVLFKMVDGFELKENLRKATEAKRTIIFTSNYPHHEKSYGHLYLTF